MLYILADKLSCMSTGHNLDLSHLREEVTLDTNSTKHSLERPPEMPNYHFGCGTFEEHRNKSADSILVPPMTPTIMTDLTFFNFLNKLYSPSGLKISSQKNLGLNV